MSIESTVEIAVWIGIVIAVILPILFHRSPMGEPSVAMQIADWWRSRKTNKGEAEQ